MIRIEINRTGDTFITKGSCRLYIHHSSPRRAHGSFRQLMNMSHFDRYGATEFSECRASVSLFEVLKTDVLYESVTNQPESLGRYDSANVIAWGMVAQAQDIMKGSVFA